MGHSNGTLTPSTRLLMILNTKHKKLEAIAHTKPLTDLHLVNKTQQRLVGDAALASACDERFR